MEKKDADECGFSESSTAGHSSSTSTKVLEHVKMLAHDAQQIVSTLASLQLHASSVNCGLQEIVKMLTAVRFGHLPMLSIIENQFENLPILVMNPDERPGSGSSQKDDHYWEFFDSELEPQKTHDRALAETAVGDGPPETLTSQMCAFENVSNGLDPFSSPFFRHENAISVEPIVEFKSSLCSIASPLGVDSAACATESQKSVGLCEVFNLSSTIPEPESDDDIYAGPLAKLEAASNFVHESLRIAALHPHRNDFFQ